MEHRKSSKEEPVYDDSVFSSAPASEMKVNLEVGTLAELAAQTKQPRTFHRGNLKIDLPYSGSPMNTSLVSPAEGTAANTESPHTVIYRNLNDVAFAREVEECTPLDVVEQSAQQSALALLQADIHGKAYGPPLHGRTARQVLSTSLPQSGSFEAPDAPRKRGSLQQLFNTHIRKNRSSCSLSGIPATAALTSHQNGGEARQREFSNAPDIISGCDAEGHSQFGENPRQSSGTVEGHPAGLLGNLIGLRTSASTDRLPGMSASASPPPPTHNLPDLVTDDEGEETSSSSGPSIGMEAVLRDASKIRGIRLTWLLYLLLTMVIILFSLLLIQIIYESNHTLSRTAMQAVQTQASSLVNSLEIEEYSLEKVFTVLNNMQPNTIDPESITYRMLHDSLCSRLYGAPLTFFMYNSTGDCIWKLRCRDAAATRPGHALPTSLRPTMDTVRILDYSPTVAVAFRSFYDATNASAVVSFLMTMDKNTLGRTLMNNNLPQYSTATLQYVTAAFLTRRWNTSAPSILFHTLTESQPTYASTTHGATHDSLHKLFTDICYEGSPFIWHVVSDFSNGASPSSSLSGSSGGMGDDGIASWPTTTTNSIPKPNLKYGRSWGQLSTASLCGVHCDGSLPDRYCNTSNPTNVWFVIEYSLMRKDGISSIVNVVGAVSIVALVIFTFVMFLVYLSIAVPVNFLRSQLLKTVGASNTQTPWQRKLVRWTYRLWLGDISAIVHSIHILGLCFQLNKKYVPDHILRIHAQQLYLSRKKLNFLDDIDLTEERTGMDETDSDVDVSSPPAQLSAANAVLAPNESRFLWQISGGNEGEDRLHLSDVTSAALNDTRAGVLPSSGMDVLSVSPSHAGGGVGALENSILLGKSISLKRGAGNPHDTSGAWPFNDPDGILGDQDVSMLMNTMGNPRSGNAMMIRRESESTILCIRIPSVELAYLMNYSTAVPQHRRIMRILLHRIRRHKGGLFHRSGDCLAAVWNAFEGCPNHAETAAICAQEIANAFAPFRVEGLHVGLVLHQGVLVCGTIEYSKAAFVTAFGDGPREAYALSELAAAACSLNILVTEPVKQELSGLFDCNIVDVIQLPNSTHPMLLFELGSSRSPSSGAPSPQAVAPLRAQFSIEYARAFAQFRNHKFDEALQSIELVRRNIALGAYEHLLRRLERLCSYYATHANALPFPYMRPYPMWSNYEAIAHAGLRSDPHFLTLGNYSMLCHSFMEGDVYKGVPSVRDEIEYIHDFKQELQENMRRSGRRGKDGGSPTLDDSSTRVQATPQLTPQLTPQPSPPIHPTATPPASLNRQMLSVLSGDDFEGKDHGQSASSATRHLDPVEWTEHLQLPAPLAPVPRPTNILPSNTPLAVTAREKKDGAARAESETGDEAPLQTGTADGTVEDEEEEEKAASAREMVSSAVADMSIRTTDSAVDALGMSHRFTMTHRMTTQPPVALGANSSGLQELMPEQTPPTTPSQPRSPMQRSAEREDETSCSIIQSAGLSFRNSVGPTQSFIVDTATLPLEIKAKNGTTYLRSTRILGKGSFGCVYLGMDSHSGRLVAIKFLPLPSDETGMEEIEAEVLILQRVNDTHVVQLMSYAFARDTIVIVMECMLAGSLQNMISAFHTIPSATARVFMRDVLRGLSKIHSMGVIHRDMKPQNVLLSLAGSCKISDFGASAYLQELARKESQGRICGTPVYLAPEAARGNPAKESDIWSCGIMFLQMITGELPYPPEQLSAGAAVLVFQIGSGIAQPRTPTNLDQLDAEFVRACLQVDPSERLTAAALLQLPIFTV